MTKTDILKLYKNGKEAARAVGRSKQAFSNWDEIVPEGIAYKYQAITKGKLKVDPSLYSTKNSPVQAA